jgi:heterodisulfide reductase subunit A2
MHRVRHCARKNAPKRSLDAYDTGLKKRKAIYVKYAQAVPLKYAIDSDNCIFFQKGKCKNCEKVCPPERSWYDEKAK